MLSYGTGMSRLSGVGDRGIGIWGDDAIIEGIDDDTTSR